ncbi:MAG: hypothetical protein H6821_15010 [Planctomycetaceae bacterium]|nr:hypothetical protein [Planctomycetales bacterium]MCB9875481.1 hypothetical protein [Planctomycetaceae bacterium]HRX81075.1 hypothetical protein [Pirellulaceae bacterium]
MSIMLNDKRTDATRPQFHDRRDAISRSRDRTLDRRHVTQIASEDEEMTFLAKYVFTLAFLGITPLLLFIIIHYFQLWFWCPI